MDFVLCDHDQIVNLDVYDKDAATLSNWFDFSDDYLGTAKTTVGALLLASGGQQTLDIQDENTNSKSTGATVTIACELLPFVSNDLTSLKKKKIGGQTTRDADAALSSSSSTVAGFVTILIGGAFELPIENKEDASSFVKVNCGEAEYVSNTVAYTPGLDALNPLYDSAIHIPLKPEFMMDDEQDGDNKIKPITISLMNKEKCLGSLVIDHETLVNAPNNTLKESKRPIGDGGAALEFEIRLAGLRVGRRSQSATVPEGGEIAANGLAENADEGTNVVRITAVKGQGFQKEHRGRFKKGDVPDLYCNIKYGSNPTVWRTETVSNSLNPIWNETKEYPLLNHSQIIHVDCYDEDSGKHDKDDLLGSVRVTVGKVILAGGTIDLELENEGKPTGAYITLCCE